MGREVWDYQGPDHVSSPLSCSALVIKMIALGSRFTLCGGGMGGQDKRCSPKQDARNLGTTPSDN